MGGYNHSQIGKSLCCRSVCLSVSRLVSRSVISISRKAVSKKERKEYIPVGRNVKEEGSRRLNIYRKMLRH